MRHIDDVRASCELDDGGHWIWQGGKDSKGRPWIFAPDYTRDPTGKTMRAQRGGRAVWHIKNRKPIPATHRIYACGVPGCVRPACLICQTDVDYGAENRSSGRLRGSLRRRLINQAVSRSKRALSDEQLAEALQSTASNKELALHYGVSETTMGKYRRGLVRAVPNHFRGLMR